jgi:hypothetical protein
MFMSCPWSAGQNLNMKISNKSVENMAKFKYLKKLIANKITFTKKLRVV